MGCTDPISVLSGFGSKLPSFYADVQLRIPMTHHHGRPAVMSWSHAADRHDSSVKVRCAFVGRNMHPRMPVVPTPARMKLLHAYGQ